MRINNIIVSVLLLMGLLVAPGLVMAEDCAAATFDSGISKFSSSEKLNPLEKGSSRGGSSSFSSSKYVKKADLDGDDDDSDDGGSIPFWAIILIVIIILLIVAAVVYFAYIRK